MELVLEIWSEPWTPPPFSFVVDLWIICGSPEWPAWLVRPRRAGAVADQGELARAEDGPDVRRWERAKAAMEHVRKVILKELDDERLAAGPGPGGLTSDA